MIVKWNPTFPISNQKDGVFQDFRGRWGFWGTNDFDCYGPFNSEMEARKAMFYGEVK